MKRLVLGLLLFSSIANASQQGMPMVPRNFLNLMPPAPVLAASNQERENAIDSANFNTYLEAASSSLIVGGLAGCVGYNASAHKFPTTSEWMLNGAMTVLVQQATYHGYYYLYEKSNRKNALKNADILNRNLQDAVVNFSGSYSSVQSLLQEFYTDMELNNAIRLENHLEYYPFNLAFQRLDAMHNNAINLQSIIDTTLRSHKELSHYERSALQEYAKYLPTFIAGVKGNLVRIRGMNEYAQEQERIAVEQERKRQEEIAYRQQRALEAQTELAQQQAQLAREQTYNENKKGWDNFWGRPTEKVEVIHKHQY